MPVQGTQYPLTTLDNIGGIELRDESGNVFPVNAGQVGSQASAGVPDATTPQLGTVRTILVYCTTAGGAVGVVVPTAYAPPAGHAAGLFVEGVARDNVANTANSCRVIARTKNLGGVSVDGGTVTLDAGGGGAPMAAATCIQFSIVAGLLNVTFVDSAAGNPVDWLAVIRVIED
jgi:hypothetical protein